MRDARRTVYGSVAMVSGGLILLDQRSTEQSTIAPLTAKSRFKMLFAGTSPRYIDAVHGFSPGMTGGLARLA